MILKYNENDILIFLLSIAFDYKRFYICFFTIVIVIIINGRTITVHACAIAT